MPPKLLISTLCHSNSILNFIGSEVKAFENIVRKVEDAGHLHFLLFHNVFYPINNESPDLSHTQLKIFKLFQKEQSAILIDCMVFNAIFNIISIISQ